MAPGDSYRPSRARSRSRSPPRGFTGNSNSRYRDREFDFESSRHLPPRQHSHSFDDRGGGGVRERERNPGSGYRARGSGGGFRGGRGGGAAGGGGAFRKWPPFQAHDRPILNHEFREKTPELMEGMVTGGFEKEHGSDGEEEMKLSADEGEKVEKQKEEEAGEAEKEKTAGKEKAAEKEKTAEKEGEKDPTVSLVLGNGKEAKVEVVEGKEFVEADKKRVDVITMIRQAKAKAAAEKKQIDSVAANDDLISLNFDDDKPAQQISDSDLDYGYDDRRKKRRMNDSSKVAAHPDSPRDVPGSRPFSHKEALHGTYVPDPIDDGPPGVGPLSRAGKLAPPPGPSRHVRRALGKRGRDGDDDDDDRVDYEEEEYDPESLEIGGHEHPDVPLQRKRKHAEISTGSKKIDGNIKYDLRPRAGTNHVPWVAGANDHSRTLKMSSWCVY